MPNDYEAMRGGEPWEAPPETPDSPEADRSLDDGSGVEPAQPTAPATDSRDARAPVEAGENEIAPPGAEGVEADDLTTAPEDVPQAEVEWQSVDDIQKALETEGAVPDEARPYVEAAFRQVAAHAAGLESAKLGLEQSKATLGELTAKLEKLGAKGSIELGNQLIGTLENVDTMSNDITRVSWRLFDTLHPEYKEIPKDHPVRAAFVAMLERGDHFTLFPTEESYYDKVERAYELAAFRTKTDLASFLKQPAQAQRAPVKPAAQAQRQVARPTISPPTQPAKRTGGALVADGSIAPTPPRRSIDELTDDEVLGANEHLLN